MGRNETCSFSAAEVARRVSARLCDDPARTYAPIIAMLIGLIFRGVAFEYAGARSAANSCGTGLCGRSMLRAFAQGLALGALVQGIPVENGPMSAAGGIG